MSYKQSLTKEQILEFKSFPQGPISCNCFKYIYRDGSWSISYYNIYGSWSRTDGPAYILFNNESIVKEVYYYSHNYIGKNKHRADGPACIIYKEDGSVIKSYYFNNKRFTSFKKLQKHIKLQNVS